LNKESNFVEFKSSGRIWAIGSIHSNLDSFNSIKKYILNNFKKDDNLVFLGNAIGLGNSSKETISSILDMRLKLMSKFTIDSSQIVFLRGAQEEMFSKILQLQIAPNPVEIIKWMFEHGVDRTLNSYGFQNEEIIHTASSGTVIISKWTSKLNQVLQNNLGHKEYFLNLKHAAYSFSKKILFVNRGVDVSRPLSAQNDCFWWGYHNFSKLDKPYSTFNKIVRGYEPSLEENFENIKNKVVCSLYRAPITNTKIIAGVFNDSAEILDLFESK